MLNGVCGRCGYPTPPPPPIDHVPPLDLSSEIRDDDKAFAERGSYIGADEFRVEGEMTALYCGLGILGFILLFITAASVGILTIIIVAIAAIVVWVQQGRLVGGAVRVTPKQFPNIHRIAVKSASRLSMELPEVFVRYDPTLNAYALGFLRKKSVVLHSATVEAMSDAELMQIIGHEFSHIKCGHTNLVVLTNSSQGIRIPIISQVMSFIFLLWSRKAEYTCDRGGLLANRDAEAAITAMCKIAVGPILVSQMSIDDFLNQQRSLDNDRIARLSETLGTHPYLVKRIHEIGRYVKSPEFARLAAKTD